jgi:hypothetical protein
MVETKEILHRMQKEDVMISDWNRFAEDTFVSPIQDHDNAFIHLRLGNAMYAQSSKSKDKGLFPHGTYTPSLSSRQKRREVPSHQLTL